MPTVGIPLQLLDAVGIAVTQPNLADTCPVLVSDATPNIVILTLISATDACIVQASDVGQAPRTLIPSTDSLALGVTDVIPTLFKSNEGIPIHLTDVASVAVVQPTGETIALSASDLPSIAVTQRVVDAVQIGLSDASPSVPLIVPVTDTLTIQASDAPPTVNTGGSSTASIAATDSVACGLTDGPPPEFAAILASDVCAVGMTTPGFGEDVNIFGFTPQQFVSVAVVDTCVVQVPTVPLGTVVKSASDMCAIQAIEPTDNSHTFLAADIVLAQSSEASSVNTGASSTQAISAADACVVQASTEAPSTVKTTFDVALSTSDTCAVQLSEASTLTSDLILVSASDSARTAATDTGYFPTRLQSSIDSATIQAVEPTDAMAFPTPFDAVGVQAVESSPVIAGSFSFNVNDSVALPETENTPVFPVVQAVLTSESIKATPVEGSLVASSVFASEALGIGLNDASLLLLKFLAVTDPLTIPISDASSLFNSFIQTVASDSAMVQASDIVTFVQQSLTQLATTESLTVGCDDTPTLTAASVGATDSPLLAAQELAAILNALFAQDSAAWRINAENANVINPFVVNATISVDDFVTSDVSENTLGLPSLLSFVVTDTFAGQLDDLSLTENIPIPDTLDFQIETSYAQVNDPQSFQTVSSKFW